MIYTFVGPEHMTGFCANNDNLISHKEIYFVT